MNKSSVSVVWWKKIQGILAFRCTRGTYSVFMHDAKLLCRCSSWIREPYVCMKYKYAVTLHLTPALSSCMMLNFCAGALLGAENLVHMYVCISMLLVFI